MILVMGLGNVLFRDDGIGVHVVRELQKNPSSNFVCAEVGTAVLSALHLLEWADNVLAIDAMQAGGKPGAIYSFEMKNGAGPESLRGKMLFSAFKFLSRKNPPGAKILGVEPESMAFGLDLSPSAQASLPRLIQQVDEIVQGWLKR